MKKSIIRKDLMIVNIGPQHPSMHGVLCLIFSLNSKDDGFNRF